MIVIFLLLLTELQIKHYVADYLLQSQWMMAGKGNWRAAGGYAHAGVHSLGTFMVLLVFGMPIPALLGIVAAEFVIHYGLDYSKVRFTGDVHAATEPRRFWALHGLDQLLHHLTYAGIVYVAMLTKGFA